HSTPLAGRRPQLARQPLPYVGHARLARRTARREEWEMNESWVTLQGWVGGEVNTREAGGTRVSTFRVGCTPRYLRNGMWVDGQTSWYTVHAWRTLGNNVAASVHKGDAVVVHGRVRVDVWEREGQPPSVTHVVEASF